jgi:hypothetical protein
MTHKKQILDFPTIICSGYTCVLHIHSAIEECTFFALKGLIDKKTRKVSQKDPKFCKQGDSVLIRIKMSRPVCVEKYKDFSQMGRFMLRDQVLDHSPLSKPSSHTLCKCSSLREIVGLVKGPYHAVNESLCLCRVTPLVLASSTNSSTLKTRRRRRVPTNKSYTSWSKGGFLG